MKRAPRIAVPIVPSSKTMYITHFYCTTKEDNMTNEFVSIPTSEYKLYLDAMTRVQTLISYYKHEKYPDDDTIQIILGVTPKPKSYSLSTAIQEPTPELEPEPEPKEKPKKTGIIPKKKDLGMLRSLLDAGWTQNKIADEFRVSPATISTWKKELEDE